jgi:hypothetical protein
MGLGMAWMQHAAYWRNRDSSPAVAGLHLQAVDWALSYYENRTTNPHYEVLTSFGAYAAARMNAEHGRNYNIHKYLDWVFSRSGVRVDLIMISGQQWGGQDVGGLMGGMRPCCTNPVQGYAFAMNTYANAMAVVPIARYEDRYARAIGKWILNAANAARLFYGNAHSAGNQSSEFWTGDPHHSIAYEGLRHHWLPPHLLAPGENPEIYAAGDPLTYDWGPLTDFGIYGSAFTGVLGSIVRTTNVEKILQLDLLATDFYRGPAHRTFLYYNPHPTQQSVAIDLGTDQPFDLYDAVSNRFLARSASGQSHFNVPADNAVMLVLVPSGGSQAMAGRSLLVDGIVIDYNATLLPDNLIRNPDVDSPQLGGASVPFFWHRSANATWSDDVALSPTHSLELDDDSATRSEEWRTHATTIPGGHDRTLHLRWFWRYEIEPGAEFHARLRLSNEPVTGVNLVNPVTELDFTVSGAATEFEIFEASIALADAVQSFDLTFITGGAAAATGLMYIDDISAMISAAAGRLAGDYNADGTVDAADYVVWRNTVGESGTGLAADGNGDQRVDGGDYDVWRGNFGRAPSVGWSAGTAAVTRAHAAIPEPASSALCLLGMLAIGSCRHARAVTGALPRSAA